MIAIITVVVGVLVLILGYYLDKKTAKEMVDRIVTSTTEVTSENIGEVLDTQIDHLWANEPAHPAYVARTKGDKA